MCACYMQPELLEQTSYRFQISCMSNKERVVYNKTSMVCLRDFTVVAEEFLCLKLSLLSVQNTLQETYPSASDSYLAFAYSFG